MDDKFYELRYVFFFSLSEISLNGSDLDYCVVYVKGNLNKKSTEGKIMI